MSKAAVAGRGEGLQKKKPSWKRRPRCPRERGRMALKAAGRWKRAVEEMGAPTIAMETGNAAAHPRRAGEAREMAADIFRLLGGLASGAEGGRDRALGEHVLSYTRREPPGHRRRPSFGWKCARSWLGRAQDRTALFAWQRAGDEALLKTRPTSAVADDGRTSSRSFRAGPAVPKRA